MKITIWYNNVVSLVYKVLYALLICISMYYQITIFNYIIPVKLKTQEEVTSLQAQKFYGISLDTAKLIYKASTDYNFNPMLITALIFTESNFKLNLKSSKGYKGILQTPNSTGFMDVDLRHGLSVLKEKMKITGGDLEAALTLYKGGNNKVAKTQAKQVIKFYEDSIRYSH